VKILVLGHKGLLGNMVTSYFKKKYDVITTDLRWGDVKFNDFIMKSDTDCIINCIGKIPQRKCDIKQYDIVNYKLPVWLDTLGINIIHPDTDENGDDLYSISKIKFRKHEKVNTKVIRTSIIGPELNGNYSFLEWFLNSDGEVNGYLNQMWNGNTTLEWSKWCEKIINDWDYWDSTTTLSNSKCMSKYEILEIFKEVYEKNIIINPMKAQIEKNNCLDGLKTTDLKQQLFELKNYK